MVAAEIGLGGVVRALLVGSVASPSSAKTTWVGVSGGSLELARVLEGQCGCASGVAVGCWDEA